MIELELTSMAHGGEAVGHYQGQAIFVPLAIPGEIALVEVVQDKGRYARARLVELVQPSPARLEPRCPHAPPRGACGGCQWQHITYEAQLQFKTSIVREQLQRLGGLADPPVQPIIASPHPWGYRNHVELSVTPDGYLGLYDVGGQHVTPIDECHVIEAALAEALDALDLDVPKLLRLGLRAGSSGDVMLILETGDEQLPGLEIDLPLSVCLARPDGEMIPLLGSTHLAYDIAGVTYAISPATFFQVNTAQAERLVQVVTGFLELHGGETVVDAYCGAGLFAAAIVQQAGHLIGIEASPSACADFERNLASADNVSLYEGEVGDVLPDLAERLDAVVLDPPRSGCERAALQALTDKQPAKIVLVSCDPATLARDLKQLAGAGYQVRRVQPLDMAPHTFHVETCVELVRRQAGG